MDMPAHHPVDPAFARGMRHGFLEIADELDRVLDLFLHVRAERPVRQLEPAAYGVEHDVGAQQEFVSLVAQEGEPARIKHHAIEPVAMRDQQRAAIGGAVDRFEREFDPAEAHPRVRAQHFVVVARDQDHARAAVRHLQDAADDFVVLVGPVPALLEPPAIDDIAHQIKRFTFD